MTSPKARSEWSHGPGIYTSLDQYKSAVCRPREDTSLHFRSVHWRVFLLFRETDRSKWLGQLADSRSAYDAMRTRFVPEIAAKPKLPLDIDPLSASTEPVSTPLDDELRSDIIQDVIRCLPELDFFRQSHIQQLMTRILFVYSKLNPDLGYRQGMHELVAPLLWVINHDALDTFPNDQSDELLKGLCDPNFIEHDAFTLFNLVMQGAKAFYEPTAHAAQNPILARIDKIFASDLLHLDRTLALHLKSLDLLPQIFLLRWIRLLFSREFSFDEVLPIWDVIFAESPDLEIVDHICLVLLLQLRWELIEADHNTALTLLLKYPDLPYDLSPHQLAIDAIRLRKGFSATTANDLIRKYSGKDPRSEIRLETVSLRTPDQQHASASRFPFSPPRISPHLATNLESLLQDAAKTVYSRGETWGINKAVRDAVDEVRKGVSEISHMPTPQAPRSAHADSSLAHRLSTLSKRNQSIASTLQSAIDDLWDFQRQAVEGKTFDEVAVQGLSAAIARVQFAQVYLQDSSIPVASDGLGADQSQESRQNLLALQVTVESPGAESTLASGVGPAPEASSRLEQDRSIEETAEAMVQTPTKQRPAIAESSYSWMLGAGEDDIASSAVSASARKSPQRARRSPALATKTGDLLGAGNVEPVTAQNEVQRNTALFNQDEQKGDEFDIGSLKKCR